ncbi:ABC transporter ATP-binding protein [Enterococcus cecorum]|uniref:ABC transporter ATP-binding protein n=1 Tax=Enterococcus cecorum TaxID=44008 RepID=UPI0006416388|nr:ABC transporter ATP-binding protein [Enterococcus cecorum]KLN92124.1 ABC transporter ATP-binding protein [Enterococcus cecorum]KLN95315.1 ABC transporter ATP-binding protein [Enterococcus cecorum]KLO66052.1 ABC transporter ATP-binding protein [Enterococcus cecorum]MDZ5501954.1 ABC transporter ATP-binding protein [Enterococcus cecorum]MDZ5556020.1 ABC transporter ATP-binding protein [Enterococcus cecorum]
MNENIAVKIDHVEKSFRLPTENTNSLKRTLVNYFKGIKGYRNQEVLRDISFEVEKGDFFGIVGRNGSGKSTLLKIISQIYYPEKGNVEVNGKLVSFIELGVGFNPELTGKENVYLNGAMLGFSTSEIDEMYDDIVEFSELADFMNQKLKNYSSGMQVRLAFAVAIQAKSDILVLDEILAVGDEAFQRKCNDYFLKAKEQEKTIILVTHSMDAVRKYCNKAVLIDKGKIKVIGTPDEVANQYSLDNVTEKGSATVIEGAEAQKKKEEAIKALPVKDLNVNLISPSILDMKHPVIEFEITYEVKEDIQTYIAFSLTDINRNVWIYNDNSLDYMTSGKGKKTLRYSCDVSMLNRCTLQLVTSIRNANHEPMMIAGETDAPTIIIPNGNRLTESERISSSGVIKRNGKWAVS